MKKSIFYLTILFLTLGVSGNAISATIISSLPYTINTSASYIITRNLTSTGNGITVNTSNVTIDLNGYSINGPGSGTNYGIYMNGKSNVEIKNGTVRNFGSHGIYEASTSGHSHRTINVRAMENGGDGIMLYSKDNLIKDCTASLNEGNGIYAGYNSLVSGNAIYSNSGYGISSAGGSTIINNSAHDNSFGIHGGNSSTLIGNTAYDNSSNGIGSFGGGSTIISNTAYSNGEHGIYSGTGSTVKNNTCYYNQHNGIYATGNNLVDGNTAYDNNKSGASYSNISSCTSCTFGTNHAP